MGLNKTVCEISLICLYMWSNMCFVMAYTLLFKGELKPQPKLSMFCVLSQNHQHFLLNISSSFKYPEAN